MGYRKQYLLANRINHVDRIVVKDSYSTEYATERRKEGMSLSQAAISAAGVRLRPILMTALTMIFGLLPLMFASGVGANGNNSLGVGAVGGMIIGTIALLFVTPAFFITFQYLEERIMGKRKADRKL